MSEKNSSTPLAKPLTGEQIAGILAQNKGLLSRRVIVIVHGQTPYQAAMFVDDGTVDGTAIIRMLRDNYGDDAVYYLIDLYAVGFEMRERNELVMRKGALS